MKIRKRDYIKSLYNIFIGRRIRETSKQIRYTVELGAKNGFEINGIGDYWGRYGSIEKIVELAASLVDENDDFTFYFPAKQYERKYSHRIGIAGVSGSDQVEVEYLEASGQCGAYFKKVLVGELKAEIERFDDITDDPETYGYIYRDWSDV